MKLLAVNTKELYCQDNSPTTLRNVIDQTTDAWRENIISIMYIHELNKWQC